MRSLLLSLMFLCNTAFASEFITTQDLSKQSRIATQTGEVIVLMLSLSDCPHCHTLRSDILYPWAISGEYENKVRFVQTYIDRGMLITGFDEQTIDAPVFAKKYKSNIATVVLFLDAKGNELSERMVGANNLDMYGYYLDQAIAEALTKI